MNNNICNKCNKFFQSNYLLQRHLKRKNPGISDDNLIIQYNIKIDEINNKILKLITESVVSEKECKFCNKIFYKKGNLERHINNACLSKKMLEQEIEEITNKRIILENKEEDIDGLYEQINHQQTEIDILKQTIEKLLNRQSSNNFTIQQIINNNINNINNNNLFVNINSFGKENLSHITEKDYKKYMSGFFPGFINFIEKIHFDINMPENHNIYITNLKSKYTTIYDNENKKWLTKDKDEIIDNLIIKNYNILDCKCEEFEEKEINEDVIKKFRTFQQHYIDKESQKNTKDNVMLLLYNNRDKVKKK